MLFYYVVIKILTDPIIIDMRRNFVLAAAVVSCNIASGIILCTVFRFIDRFFYDKPTVAPVFSRRIRTVFKLQAVVFYIADFMSEQIRNDDISKSSYAEIIAVKI